MGTIQAMSESRSAQIAYWLTTRPEYKSFPDFAGKYLKVLNRPETSGKAGLGKMVPFVMNAVQRDLYERIQRNKAAGKPSRFIILKARRMGLSTLIQTYMMHQALTNMNRKMFVISADRVTTNNIILMAKSMFTGLPSLGARVKDSEWKAKIKENPHVHLRPQHRRSNDNELWFGHPNDESKGLNSRFQVILADRAVSTRSFECHLAHLSEEAHFEDSAALLLPMMQTLSDDPDTLVARESTANGAGGHFYRDFWRFWGGPGKPELLKGDDEYLEALGTDWESIFYPWHAMPDYKRELPGGVTAAGLIKTIPGELAAMVDEYTLSPEQTYWAFRVWADKCQGDWDLFKQEYPGKPAEAFAFAATRVFPERDLAVCEDRAQKRPMFVGDIVNAKGALEARSRIETYSAMEPEFQGDGKGPLWVWSWARKESSYLLFCDPSSGSQTGDNTGIQVIEVGSRRQVAEFARPVSPIDAARKLVLLALHYNNALIAWEINGVGHAVSHALMESGYWNLFVREQVESIAEEQRFGWSTTIATKPMMIAVGEDIIQRRLPVILSSRLYGELRHFLCFAKKATNYGGVEDGMENYRRLKTGAPPGENDDLVMSWLGAQMVCDLESGRRAWESPAEDRESPKYEGGRPVPAALLWDDDGEVETETEAEGRVAARDRFVRADRWL